MNSSAGTAPDCCATRRAAAAERRRHRLYAHLTKPEHTIRHRWRTGDVGIWDNRSTSHYANRDHTATRVMRRITLAGDRPVGPTS